MPLLRESRLLLDTRTWREETQNQAYNCKEN